MLTWHIDRMLRAGPLCAIATFVMPAVLAILVASVSDVENVLGIMLVASGIILMGSVAGSVVAASLGVLLFMVGAFFAEVSIGLLFIVGLGLFATLIVHDLAGAFRRAPHISARVWKNAAVVAAAIGGASALIFAPTYLLGTLRTWQTIIVPFGIAGVGFAAKLAADSHAKAARELTAKTNTSQ